MTPGPPIPHEPDLTAPFVEWLRWALDRKGFDLEQRGVQREIADRAGLPAATVSRLLRGHGQPDTDTCYQLGVLLDRPVIPILVRAGHLPPQVLDQASGTRPSDGVTEDQAWERLGVPPHLRPTARRLINALATDTETG